MDLLYEAARGIAGLAVSGLHRVLRVFARGGDLGLYQRGVSEPRAGERAEPGKLFALDHERRDLGDLPLDGGKVWRGAVSVFCGYDGGAVFCGVADLPGNEGDFAGADAEEPGDRVAPGVSRDSI